MRSAITATDPKIIPGALVPLDQLDLLQGEDDLFLNRLPAPAAATGQHEEPLVPGRVVPDIVEKEALDELHLAVVEAEGL